MKPNETREGGRKGGVSAKRTSAQIEDEYSFLGALLVQAISDGSSGGLVDDTEDVQAGDGTWRWEEGGREGEGMSAREAFGGGGGREGSVPASLVAWR